MFDQKQNKCDSFEWKEWDKQIRRQFIGIIVTLETWVKIGDSFFSRTMLHSAEWKKPSPSMETYACDLTILQN